MEEPRATQGTEALQGRSSFAYRNGTEFGRAEVEELDSIISRQMFKHWRNPGIIDPAVVAADVMISLSTIPQDKKPDTFNDFRRLATVIAARRIADAYRKNLGRSHKPLVITSLDDMTTDRESGDVTNVVPHTTPDSPQSLVAEGGFGEVEDAVSEVDTESTAALEIFQRIRHAINIAQQREDAVPAVDMAGVSVNADVGGVTITLSPPTWPSHVQFQSSGGITTHKIAQWIAMSRAFGLDQPVSGFDYKQTPYRLVNMAIKRYGGPLGLFREIANGELVKTAPKTYKAVASVFGERGIQKIAHTALAHPKLANALWQAAMTASAHIQHVHH